MNENDLSLIRDLIRHANRAAQLLMLSDNTEWRKFAEQLETSALLVEARSSFANELYASEQAQEHNSRQEPED